MMEDAVVDVKNISMCFNLYKEKIDNIKEYIIKLSQGKLHFEEFWALKNISFHLEKGDSLGIIGKNGSGKSTLLKLLSRVMKPTEGIVEVQGDIAPLIELGAGFDYDLTARENIFLNGAILGYSNKYMRENFDEIIEFSELENFVDVPMKNFSSGMVARLGFAISTMHQSDILIVDEILSVGDFKFRMKCEQRLQLMLSKGTILLLVSHDSTQIEQLCNKALWLDGGIIREYGDSAYVCKDYAVL